MVKMELVCIILYHLRTVNKKKKTKKKMRIVSSNCLFKGVYANRSNVARKAIVFAVNHPNRMHVLNMKRKKSHCN